MGTVTGLLSAMVVLHVLSQTEALSNVNGHCTVNPCKNGGTCLERVDGFVCDCASDYTGLQCDIFKYCNPSPCLHGGKCIETITSYKCDCTGTGYEGFTCHVPHDDCQPNSCLHGGRCIDGVNNYTCACIPGFTGAHCEVEISACRSNPCINGGTCFDVHAGSSQASPSFQCQCVEGFAGARCQTNYDDCAENDCAHGVCVDGINSHTCNCSNSGYYGVYCEKKYIDQCSLRNPCQNDATCVQDGNDYHCDCLPFKEGRVIYDGKNCSVLLRGCLNVHVCQNGGVCIPVLLNEAKNIHDYTCSCNHGFKGRVCDTVTSMTMDTGSYIRKTYATDYKLSMRFKTSDQNGLLLYDRLGDTFISVEIVNGSLHLASGNSQGIRGTAAAITSERLDDSHWHNLVLDVSSNTTLTLEDPLCKTTDNCILSVQRPHAGSFREFFIGQVTISSWLTETLSHTGFVGCVQDVFFNAESVLPSNVGVAEFHNIKMDCPACLTHTCQGQGHCQPSEKTGFKCYCATSLVNGLCLPFDGVACDFESGMCGWRLDSSSRYSWTRHSGPTLSFATGPPGDHTTGRGYYIYTEASDHIGVTMKLDSIRFNVSSSTCLSVWINMYGKSMGTLRIYQKDGYTRYTLISLSGDQGPSWIEKKASLIVAHNTFLQLEGTTGTAILKQRTDLDYVVDYCTANTCKHGGTCHERVDGFVCDCVADYTGIHCDIFNYCNSSPCLHGGKCIETVTSYKCDCTGTGYEGFTCHVPHDDCQPNSCLNGGRCIDGVGNFTCACIPGFTGAHCEVEISACVSNPCINGGTCFDVHAGSSQASPSFQCQCVEGFAGDRCETNYDDCADNDCAHGVCVDGINSHTCDCSNSGYYGVHCENKYIDQCSLHYPCQNDATCVQEGNDYHCHCLPFKEGHVTHGGKNCSVLLRGCSNVHICQNGGVCIPVLLNEAKNIHDYTCSCSHGFKGRVCDTVTSMTMDTGSYIRKTYATDYKLSMRFKTTNQNGVLFYDHLGDGFISVELVNGSLYLASGNPQGIREIVNAITSEKLSDSHWHSLVLDVSSNTTLTLDDRLCNTTADCILSVQRPHAGFFREFFIGQVTVSSWLKKTLSHTGFVGCVQDIFFNVDSILPSNFGVAEFHNIKMDCPACLAHTCEGQGQCRPSQKTGFECYCASALVNGLCPVFKGIECDFESGMCSWRPDSTSRYSWTRHSGSTSSVSTGPTGDHTTGRGYYIYTEASSHSGVTMKFDSIHFDVTSATCLSLWINMYGSSMGTLRINQIVGTTKYTLYTLRGSHGTSWFEKRISLNVGSNTYLQLEGTIGNSYTSDMAVDDIKLFAGKC